ncbi:MAG: hypothetical protein LBF74_13620 [Treponema sp.]|nr:hypothetical protein [Treponema sp.]
MKYFSLFQAIAPNHSGVFTESLPDIDNLNNPSLSIILNSFLEAVWAE